MKNSSRKMWAVANCIAMTAMIGCAVDQTQEARAPAVDVEVDPGRWPEFDVRWTSARRSERSPFPL